MKIAVLGAGAMGSLYGAYLSLNNDVYMIDVNNKVVDTINEKGITIFERGENIEANFKLSAVTDSKILGKMDLVIVFVKNLYTISAMESNKNLIGEDTLVLTLQNGAGNDRDLQQFIKKENILIGTTEHNCSNLQFGQVAHNSTGMTNLGMVIYNEEVLKKISVVFEACNIKTAIYENIQKIIWSKLFINMSLNSVTAILQCRAGYLHDSEAANAIVRNIISEAVEVAIADGTYFKKEEVIENIENHLKNDFHEIITSMSQDIKNKRITEIDHINGAVVRAAREYGIKTPYNEMVVHLIHAIEGTYRLESI